MTDPARPLRALVVDDEHLARLELRRLLGAHPEVEVVGEAASADEAEAAIGRLSAEGRPVDLLFLDVQMPGRNGFELLQTLVLPGGVRVPEVVFATAYDAYALRAFEVSALDYLLKPVEADRLAEAVRRAVARRAPTGPNPGSTVGAGTDDGPEPPGRRGRPLGPDDRVFVRDGERFYFLRLGDVRLIEGVGNYAQLHAPGARPLVHRSLRSLEGRLDPAVFFRANRSQIVNLAFVDRVDDALNGGLLAKLLDGTEVELSRRRAELFRDWLSL